MKYVIVSDFDGTITREDSNSLLVEACGNPENARIEADFISGYMSSRDAFIQHFDAMRISLTEYIEFIESNIAITEGFDKFLEITRKLEVPMFIVTGGYHQAVTSVLGDERLSGVEVYANNLSGEPHIKPVFRTKNPICEKAFGPCGNCKRDCIRTIRRESGRKILFIGDGITDHCAVEEADLIFAKDFLAEYCKEQALPYVTYKDFTDIIDYLGWCIT